MKNIITCAALLLSVSLLPADVPSLTNYQGLLTDINGNVVSGSKSISIAVFDASTNGAQLYSESLGSVTVQNGVYSFQFGSGPGFATAISTGTQHWLQVTIDAIAQTPRERLVSVPFALKAAVADSLAPAPESDIYLPVFLTGQLVDATGVTFNAPLFLPTVSRSTSSKSIFQPIPSTIKHISELAGNATTTIGTGTLTLNVIRRNRSGADTQIATVQKSGATGTSTVNVSTDLTLDHANYFYFIEAAFVAGGSGLLTTLNWVRLHAEQ
jgi:hypothetical protein